MTTEVLTLGELADSFMNLLTTDYEFPVAIYEDVEQKRKYSKEEDTLELKCERQGNTSLQEVANNLMASASRALADEANSYSDIDILAIRDLQVEMIEKDSAYGGQPFKLTVSYAYLRAKE